MKNIVPIKYFNESSHYLRYAAATVFVALLLSNSVSVAQTGNVEEEIPLMKLEEITDFIMSPGCDYIYTLTLCPSSEAAQMRELVKDKIRAGESKEVILDYFEQVYGPRVLAQPAKKGFYFVAWWFPYFLLADAIIIGGVILFIWRKRTKEDVTESGEDESGAPAMSESDMNELAEEEIRKFRDE